MNEFPKHPSLYEINTRVLLSSLGKGSTLSDIPAKFWKGLQEKRIDWIWLMGVWELQEKALNPHLIPEDMLQEFRALMPDLTDQDICGSPYAIHDYIVDPDIGDERQLRDLRRKLNKMGMKLMLDFVPNHLGAHTRWIRERPEFFIEVTESVYTDDPVNYYQPFPDHQQYFAHGRDPYFDAWQDTVQINYFNPAVHGWLTGILMNIAEVCDGVRCDMAMLPVQRVFGKTWKAFRPGDDGIPEFWSHAIAEVKRTHRDFLFLAECYWDMEAELMHMGFDYCYDKVFYDRIGHTDTDKMRQHFHAEPWWLLKTARFLENHDEQRISAFVPLQKHLASAALVAFGPGMRFWHMGQWEGRRKRIPVQLRRMPAEAMCSCLIHEAGNKLCTCVSTFYRRLIDLGKTEIFRNGEWSVIHDHVEPGLILWLWTLDIKRVLVAINYRGEEVPFSLTDRLRALHLSGPVDFITRDKIDAGTVTTLAPWGIYVWKMYTT